MCVVAAAVDRQVAAGYGRGALEGLVVQSQPRRPEAALGGDAATGLLERGRNHRNIGIILLI